MTSSKTQTHVYQGKVFASFPTGREILVTRRLEAGLSGNMELEYGHLQYVRDFFVNAPSLQAALPLLEAGARAFLKRDNVFIHIDEVRFGKRKRVVYKTAWDEEGCPQGLDYDPKA